LEVRGRQNWLTHSTRITRLDDSLEHARLKKYFVASGCVARTDCILMFGLQTSHSIHLDSDSLPHSLSTMLMPASPTYSSSLASHQRARTFMWHFLRSSTGWSRSCPSPANKKEEEARSDPHKFNQYELSVNHAVITEVMHHTSAKLECDYRFATWCKGYSTLLLTNVAVWLCISMITSGRFFLNSQVQLVSGLVYTLPDHLS
jgi:hypothetical protein